MLFKRLEEKGKLKRKVLKHTSARLSVNLITFVSGGLFDHCSETSLTSSGGLFQAQQLLWLILCKSITIIFQEIAQAFPEV